MARPLMASFQPADRVNPVVIVGGGLSGLAAGVELSSRRIPVIILEQRAEPGGRAYSFVDDTTGETIDNGQHVMIAGYARTLRLLQRIGTRDRLAIQAVPELHFHHPERGHCTLRLLPLPSPLHLLGGIATTRLFGVQDKVRLLQAGQHLTRFRSGDPGAVAEMTVEQWLDAANQSAEGKRSLWEPLAIAIMNEHIGVASAAVFLRSLQMAFLDDRRGASIALPTVGLSELFVHGARAFIERHGGEVRCRADVTGSHIAEGRITSVELRDGTSVQCSALILAVPSLKVRSLLPEPLRSTTYLAAIEAAPLSPIVSLHLWFAWDFMPQTFLGVIGRRTQWLFNRRKITHAVTPGGHISAVISAGHDIVEMSNTQLIALIREDLRALYGAEIPEAEHAVVIREKRATFSCTPAVERIRPGNVTPVENMFLAGDWTATGLPATIEGAITSGEQCADLATHAVASR